MLIPRPFSRQIETIPEYEPETVPNTLPIKQANANNIHQQSPGSNIEKSNCTDGN